MSVDTMNDHEVQAGGVVTPSHASKGGRKRATMMVLVAVAGVAAGVIAADPIRRLFGRAGGASGGDDGMAGMDMSAAPAATQPARTERKIKYYWDPMQSPPYISDRPGTSPMGMQLIPVYEDDIAAGPTVTIDPVVVQNIGVRVAEVQRQSLATTFRAVGYVQERAPDRRDINLRISGWIEKLYADTEGMYVKKGDPLFTLYSPELTVGIESLISARKAQSALPANADATARSNTALLVESARQKLELWGLSSEQIEQFAKLDRAPGTVTFTSPINAHVVEKLVFTGSAVKAGDLVLRLADRSTVWLDVQVFEKQLSLVHEGQTVKAVTDSVPDKTFDGRIIFIHPHVDEMTRTALVRIEIPNPTLELRQGMYATAQIATDSVSGALTIPREAVIDTGTRQLVFAVEADNRFAPRIVKTGVETTDGTVQVLSGLAPGEKVVTSGQFLLDSESRLREAIRKQLEEQLLKPGKPQSSHAKHEPQTPGENPAGHEHEGMNMPMDPNMKMNDMPAGHKH